MYMHILWLRSVKYCDGTSPFCSGPFHKIMITSLPLVTAFPEMLTGVFCNVPVSAEVYWLDPTVLCEVLGDH